MVIDRSVVEEALTSAREEKADVVKMLQTLDQEANDVRAQYQIKKAKLVAMGMHADGRITCCEDLLRLQKSGGVE